jgi:NADH dehydrogenase
LVIVVGGGFAGLAAARALASAPVDVQIVDRQNHHVFQPLLYQVATAALSPAEISAPIRAILHDQANCAVALAEVQRVDLTERRLYLQTGYVQYDYLVLAAGARHAYFGHDEWEPLAPGLKTLTDALELRRRILLAFESAEYEGNEGARRARVTFGIVGGGPTGVELAGAIKEIAGRTLPRDYRRIDTRTTRVLHFEAGPRLLPSFPDTLSARAKRDLERMGIEVRLGSAVSHIDQDGIEVGAERIPLRNVFWAAGVRAADISGSLGVPLDKAGRVIVEPDLSVPGHPEVFVAGDMAAARSGPRQTPVPGVAQAAIQMGRFAGRMIARRVAGARADRGPAFVYHDRGSLAVIGTRRAVADIGGGHLTGFPAWLIWAGVHIVTLIGFRNRVQVALSWAWNWLFGSRDARLITGPARLQIERVASSAFVPSPVTGSGAALGSRPTQP